MVCFWAIEKENYCFSPRLKPEIHLCCYKQRCGAGLGKLSQTGVGGGGSQEHHYWCRRELQDDHGDYAEYVS